MSWAIRMRLGALMLAGLALAGCDSIQGNQTPVFSATEENAAARKFDTAAVVEDYFKAGMSAEQRTDYRDKIITLRLNAINTNYRAFVTELREARAGTGLIADGTTTALGLLTVILGGAATKTALGAGVTAVGSAKGSFDKNVFYEQALAAVIAQMDAQRADVTRDINLGMKLPAKDYSLVFALDDLARLERAGSIEAAIAGLTKDAKDKAKKAEDRSAEVKAYSEAQTRAIVTSLASVEALQAVARSLPDDKAIAIAKADHAKGLPLSWAKLQAFDKTYAKSPDKPASAAEYARELIALWIPRTDPAELSYWEKTLK